MAKSTAEDDRIAALEDQIEAQRKDIRALASALVEGRKLAEDPSLGHLFAQPEPSPEEAEAA